jgi:hypothetical protein
LFVALKGSSAVSVTAGILLLTRARSFGLPLEVEIVGDPTDVAVVHGPALVHSAVLASCGVGREHGAGALVIVPGPSTEPLAVSLSEDGTGPWFLVDRTGKGAHPATQAFVRLYRTSDPSLRDLGKQLRRALSAFGVTAEPAILDLVFGSPEPPIVRAAVGLRAGRSMTQAKSEPITRFLDVLHGELPDTLPSPCTRADLFEARRNGGLQQILDRFNPRARDEIETWLERMFAVMETTEEFDPLVLGLAEVVSHLAGLPAQGIVMPLDAQIDAIAVGLAPALGATSPLVDANKGLVDLFQYLGGRFTTSARYPVVLPGEPVPEGRLARWQWLCRATRQAADAADSLWKQVVDPPQ